jgi:hypothetical protein
MHALQIPDQTNKLASIPKAHAMLLFVAIKQYHIFEVGLSTKCHLGYDSIFLEMIPSLLLQI